jgi:hypothetical protein
MSAVISPGDVRRLRRPHVARAWFGVFDFPVGTMYLHSGVGSVEIGGNEYIGVSDPLSGRLVQLSQVEEPQFGQASAVQVILTGASKEFIQSVHATAREIEGRSAVIYWAAFDAERQTLITDLVPLFPRGRMSSPAIYWQGIGIRYVTLTIENIWSAKNFAPGGRWTPADQRRRFPGDKGLDFVNVKVSENWQ